MRGGKDERVARSLREREMVCDGVHLVDKLTGFRCLFEDQFPGSQCELLNLFAVRQQEFKVIRIGWTQSAPSQSIRQAAR